MSAVLVTGAGGFLGSAVVRQLVRAQACFVDGTPIEHVVAVLRPGGSSARLDELPGDGSWAIEYADVFDPESLAALLDSVRPRAVVHAALDRDSYDIVDEQRFAAAPLAAILGSLHGVRDSRYVHVGSAWSLAGGDQLDETAPVRPASPYGENKARADALLAELAERSGVPWVNLRLFNLFGRYEDPARLLPTLVAKLVRGAPVDLTHGRQVRDFNDVDTVAQAFAAALAAPDSACGRVYHIGSGRGTTVREFAALVATSVGSVSELRYGALPSDDEELDSLVANPQLARSMLGWDPDPDLPAAVRKAVDWQLSRLGHAAVEVPA